ncbi:MAG: hypothetical protein K8S62_04305 [Candidatus Sabulitectum sp.]|nr:hypothetical protein [Candidatus Sabulitectum sp.]
MKLAITVLIVFVLAGSALADTRIFGTCDPGSFTEAVRYTVDVYDDHATWMCIDDQLIDNVWKSINLDPGAYKCHCIIYDSHGTALAAQTRGWVYILGGNTRCDFVFTDTLLSLSQITWASIKTVIK